MINKFNFNAEFYVINSISAMHPDRSINSILANIPRNVKLADPQFYIPQHVDMLIAADMFFELLSLGQIMFGEHPPVLQKTLLGWIVSEQFFFIGRCGNRIPIKWPN